MSLNPLKKDILIGSSSKDSSIEFSKIACTQKSHELFKRLNFDRYIRSSLRKLDMVKTLNSSLTRKEKTKPHNHTELEQAKDLLDENNKRKIQKIEEADELDKRLDSSCVDTNSFELSTSERVLIDQWTQAFYNSRKMVSLDFDLQSRLEKIGNQNQKISSEYLHKMNKAIMANFLLKPILRIIQFVKMIPDFFHLDPNDQINLLNGGAMEMFICSSSSLYDHYSNKLVDLVSRELSNSDRQPSFSTSQDVASANSSLEVIRMDILKMIWSEDLFEKTIKFMKSMSELKIDETTLILMLPLILFSPDRLELTNRQIISSIQAKYSFLLKKYLKLKCNLKNTDSLYQDPDKLFNRLLLVLVELRSLQEMHSSFLMDVDATFFDSVEIV